MPKHLISFGLAILVVSALHAAPDLQWHSTDTEHFTFVYRAEHRWAADHLVGFAEEVYSDVTTFFESTPDRVDVVVYGESDLANGYYSPAPPQHIGLYVAQPTLPFLGARTESWLRSLLVHELTHFVHANYDRGLFHILGSVFGRSLSGLSLGLVPLWTTEGLAINAETMLGPGGRGRDPFFEMKYKAPIVEDRLFSLDQAGYDSHLAPAGRYYVAGYFIWDYLLDEYGEQYVVELMNSFSRFPFFGIWGPVRWTTGQRMKQIYEEITANLVRDYADAARREPAARFSPDTRADYYLPTATEQGLYLYRTRPDRTPAIVSYDPDSGFESALLEMRLTDHASWSVTRDGWTIAFATVAQDTTFPDERAVYSDIYLFDVESGRITQLTSGGGFHQPAISPDGSYLVAVQRSEGFQRLVRIDLVDGDDNHSPRALLEIDAVRFYAPSVSPDGNRVVVAANQQGRQQIMLVEAVDGEYRLVETLSEGAPYFPTFEDTDTILYGHDRGGTLSVYRQRLATSAVELVATDRIGAYSALRVEEDLVFATYTSDGYTLRNTTAARPDSDSPDDLPTEATQPIREIEAPAPVTGTPYTPIPWPTFWLPAVGLAGPGISASGLGGGLQVYGADLLQRNEWQVSAVYFPALTQIDHSAAWNTNYGPLALSLLSQSRYSALRLTENDTIHAKLFQNSLYVRYALMAQHRLGLSRTLAVGAGAAHSLGYLAEQQFGISELSSSVVDLDAHEIVVGADLSASRTPLSSLRASHAPGALRADLSVVTPLLAPGFRAEALLAQLAGSANVGIAASDHVVDIAPTVNYATDIGIASPLHLRGFEKRTDHTASSALRGRYRLSVDYHTPHILVDLPLASGVGITGFGFTVFAEATGGYEFVPAAATIDRQIGLGGEFTTVVTYWQKIPITLGVATRIDPGNPGSFSVFDDVAIYVRSDFLESLPVIPQYLLPQK